MTEQKIEKKFVIKRDIKALFPKEFTNRDLIGKFFDYVMNNFFQQSFEKYINGYVGRKTNTLEDGDYYIKEPTLERELYQLTPMLIDKEEKSQNIKDVVDYNNFINTLKLQGCLTNDHNRLLSNEHWSYCPPIDPDMFLNFNFYYWVEEGIKPITLSMPTNAVTDILGKERYTYEYVDEEGHELELVFENGLRITFINDANEEYNNRTYIVEGVGTGIILVDDTEIYPSDDKSPDYFVMDRGCRDGNPWSLRNRWFHINTIKLSNQYNEENIVKEYQQAKYPILCFNRDIELYNFGNYSRGYVDLITTELKNHVQGTVVSDNFNEGKLQIGSKNVGDGAVIVFTNEPTEDSNNMLYKLSLVPSSDDTKIAMLYPITNGLNSDGRPVKGECFKLKNAQDECWFYNGSEWVSGQQKTEVCQSPLFNLYNVNKKPLDDETDYPLSTFNGNTLFNYKEVTDTSVSVNSALKRKITTSGYGNYVFDNTIESAVYKYKEITTSTSDFQEIQGMRFFKINGTDNYSNAWHLSKDVLTQYVMTQITVTDDRTFEVIYDEKNLPVSYEVFDLAYTPYDSEYKKNVFVYLNGKLLENTTYMIKNKKLYVSMDLGLNVYDVIFIRMLIDRVDELVDGYYFDLPLTLTSNSFNEGITEIKYNEMFSQMETILESQIGFEGLINGANNFKDTKKDLSLGTRILQHSSPIVKTMLLNDKEYTDVKTVLTFISDEYTKFKNKFLMTINTMVNNGSYPEYDKDWVKTDPLSMVIKALKAINIGKEGLHPFYNNGVAEQLVDLNEYSENYLVYPYIPSTPAYLGIDNCYEPRIIPAGELIGISKDVLLCHDGSYAKTYGDYRDESLLELERQIYESINNDFKEGLPKIIKQKYIPGKFRNTEYSYNDYIKLLTPLFERWTVKNNYDYSINNTFDETNPFTWNWSSCYDKDGFQLQGSYRGIYLYYYDSDKPHTNPWEMLGFGSKPEWWENHYGPAPYTSENIPMWRDIEEGHIIDGISEGYYEEFKRPGLVENYLPVDNQGNLLDPYNAGIATSKPIITFACKEWKIGDIGSIENFWRYTHEYHYSLQELLYLMKPTDWIETTWDSINTEVYFPNTPYEQIININTSNRDDQRNIIVHNELVDGEYVRKLGSQQWFSDFLTKECINITDYIGNDLRNMDIRLGYRCAGFYNKDSMRIITDNYGVIPSNNYHLKLSEKITGNVFRYSAMNIIKQNDGWVVDGYDAEHPYFDILPIDKESKKSTVSVNGRTFTYYHGSLHEVQSIKYKTVFTSAQDLYNTIIGYGRYLESQGFSFNYIDENGIQIDFVSSAKTFLYWYTNSEVTNGMVLSLNPMGYSITLIHNAFADNVGRYFNGFWSMMDLNNKPILNKDVKIYRHNGYITIEPNGNYNIGSAKITTSEKENVLILDNTTIYNDVIYDSLKGTKTERIKLLGVKSDAWDGTYFAPGYVIAEDDSIVPNYDKLANDLNYVYDSDDIRSFNSMGDEAKKSIGYHRTNYMQNLLIDDRNMFDFYKGMLSEKGTRKPFNKLNRSTHIMSDGNSNLQLYEYWAFNLGQFGFTKNKSTTELLIRADDINHDPQLITFSSDPNYTSSDRSNISINWSDLDWLKKNSDQDRNTFLNDNNVKKLPTGGFAHLNDAKYVLATKDELDESINDLDFGDKVWVVKDNEYTWNMYKRIDDDAEPLKSLKVRNIKELLAYNCLNLSEGDLIYVENDLLNNWRARLSDNSSNEIEIYIKDPHGLLKNQNYKTDIYGWSVFKYSGIKPYSYVLSMPNGIVSVENDGQRYSVKIKKGILVNMPDGLTEGVNTYYPYELANDINILSNDDFRYIVIDQNNNLIRGTTFTDSEEEPEASDTLSFWYNPLTNLLSKWNGLYWENSSEVLYAWKYGSSEVYTRNEVPSEGEQTYVYNGDNIELGDTVSSYFDKLYAWKIDDDVFYTDSAEPRAGDKVYSSDKTTIVDYVTSYFAGSEYFYCNEVDPITGEIISSHKYFRNSDIDSNPTIGVNSHEYSRLEDNDIYPTHYSILGEVNYDGNNLLGLDVALPFTLERIEEKPINMDVIKSVYLVDNDTDRTLSKLNFYNPLYGVIPEVCENEIDYITSYDPVSYNDPAKWYDEKLGELWWDTSKVRYLDYYQSDLIYRRNNWGKQLPGSEIAIMEWTKTTVLPEDITKYIKREVYNPQTNKNDVYYYYWLKNPSTQPDYDFRTTSAYDISRKINSAQDSGMLWFSPVCVKNNLYDESSFVIGNFDDITVSKDFVIQINYQSKENVDDHNEWYMISEDYDENIPDKLWNKMKASLVTKDELNQNVPDISLPDAEKYGILLRPRQSMFKDVIKARQNFVEIVNYILGSRDVKSSDLDDMEELTRKDNYDRVSYEYEFETHEEMMKNTDVSLIGFNVLVKSDEVYDNIWTLWRMDGIGEYQLLDYQQYDMGRYSYYIDAFLNKEYTKDTYNKKFNLSTDEGINEYNRFIAYANIPDGYIIRIDDETGEWRYLQQYNAETGTFVVVGIHNGYIQFKDTLYTYMIDVDTEEFIDGKSKYDYINDEVEQVIKYICDYFYDR